EAFHRYQYARQHWEEGKSREAGLEVDEASWLLSSVQEPLDPQQAQVREALQESLSELIVLLNEAASGASKGPTGPIEQLGPISLEMNARIQREIDLYSTTQRETFLTGFELAGAHLPYIQRKLGEYGLPRELGWLPLIESGFKTQAESGAKAL